MKLSIERHALLTGIQQVQKAVTSRTTIPILSGIRLQVTAQGLYLTATDLEIGIETYIPAVKDEQTIIQDVEEGGIVLPARFFVDIVKKLPSDTIHIEVQDHFLTTLSGGTSEFHILGMDADEFPRLPQVSGHQIFSVPADVLRQMIQQTVFAVSADEIRPVLTGVVFSLKNGVLRLVATDSHRLAQRDTVVEAPADMSFGNVIVPGKSLNELGRLLPEDDQLVDVVVANNQILVKMDNTQFYSRLIDGQYPDTSRICPTTFKVEVLLSKKELAEAIERVFLIARENDNNVVRVQITPEQMLIASTSADVGKVTETLTPKRVNGEDLLLAFNAKYVMEALRVLDTEDVLLQFTGSMSPFLLKNVDDDRILQLVLPIRMS